MGVGIGNQSPGEEKELEVIGVEKRKGWRREERRYCPPVDMGGTKLSSL